MIGYCLEYKVGDINLVPNNILVSDINDMQLLEFWEERLRGMSRPFAVVYRKGRDGLVSYSILVEMQKKGNPFR